MAMGMPPGPLLSERRQAILRAIVHEHVTTARTVSSETIARDYALGVSSATIRNEMAALEEMGYIYQAHTSAGRVPSEQGYRFYVERLMEEPTLSPMEQQTIVHQFHQANLELNEWLRLAAAVLAHNVHNAALVTAPRARQARFKHLELISIQESLALLVAVFDGGVVQQQMFVPVVSSTQDDLSRAATRTNRMLEEHILGSVAEMRASLGESIEAQVLDLVARMMHDLDAQANADVFVDGLDRILSQPEFSLATRGGHADGGAVQVVQLMQQGMMMNEMIRQLSATEGLQIIIGSQGPFEEMRQVSIVLSRYGNTTVGGLLGVLGPTRMHYGRAVAVVRYISGILGEMATGLGGNV